MARVLHVSTGLDLNGAERILVNCCEASQSAGFEPYVISLKSGGGAVPLLETLGVPVFQLGAIPRRPNLGAFLQLRRLVKELKPDLVKGWMYHGNLFASAAVWGLPGLGGRRLTWGIYNSALEFSQYHWSMKATVQTGARLSGFPTAIAYNSLRAQADHVAAGYASRGSLQIGNGVNLRQFRPRPEIREPLRVKFGINPDAFVAIIVARVDPQKDWNTVLRGIARVPGLITVAVGPTTTRLSDQEGLLKIGAQSDMASIYPLADVFLLPSAFGEGTSVAMCEAMATGIPAIVTDVGDHARFIDSGGLLVPKQDPEALASALVKLMTTPDLMKSLSAGARQVAEEHFGMSHSFKSLFDAWNRMLD